MIFVGVIALVGAFLIPYGLGAEMLNFGALIAFMGVNAASFMHYYVRAQEKKLTNLIPPVLGFLVCLLLWLNLSRPAQKSWAGSGCWWDRFRSMEDARIPRNLIDFELPPEEA